MGIIGVAKISSGYVLTGQTDSEIPLAEENGVMMKVDKSGTDCAFGTPAEMVSTEDRLLEPV